MKKQSGKNELVILMRNLFLIKINIKRAGIFPLSKQGCIWSFYYENFEGLCGGYVNS